MKKLVFVFAAAVCMLLSANTAKAQLYFGGSIGFTTTSQKTPTATAGQFTTTSGASLRFIPEVGYKINNRMAVGGRVGYGTGAAAFGDIDPNGDFFNTAINEMQNDLGNARSINTSFTFAPYFRFVIFDGRRLSFFAEATAVYGNIANKTKDGQGVWQDGGKMTMLEIGVKPGFSLSFDNHFSIVGHLGFLGFQSLTNAQTDASVSRFGLSMSSNSVTFGFVYSL